MVAERPLCTTPECVEHYACRLRGKGIRVSPRVNSQATRNWRPSVSTPPAHWANQAYETRPDGSKSPLWNADGSPVRHKQFSEQQATITDNLARSRAQIAQGALNPNG